MVFYVTPGAEGRAAAACYGVEADGRVVCDFRFEAVRLWEIDADELLRRPAPALWAVVALARGAELAHVGRAAAQVGHEVADEAMRRELLAVLYNVSGTRFEAGGLRALIPREVLMRSTTYDEIVQEGEERGLLKGRIQGELEGQVRALQRVCRRVAELKLSPLPASLAAIIEGLSEPAHLEALLLDLTAAADADAARAALARHAR